MPGNWMQGKARKTGGEPAGPRTTMQISDADAQARTRLPLLRRRDPRQLDTPHYSITCLGIPYAVQYTVESWNDHLRTVHCSTIIQYRCKSSIAPATLGTPFRREGKAPRQLP